jgi:sugar O-acyltransferase (sialic acid O-acetyltransferase NeuD family)
MIHLFGASGHGKVVRDILLQAGQPFAMFWDDDPLKTRLGESEVTHASQLPSALEGAFIITVGNNKIRKEIAQRMSCSFAMAVHPSAVLASGITPGEGTVIMAGAIVNTDTHLGRHVILNTSSSIDHDCRIGDFVHISPGAILCGGVQVGEGAHIGAGATIIPGISIGKWATIGAGAVVIRDVPDHAKVVGNPGRIIQ